MTEFKSIDVVLFLFCATVWLTPFLGNGVRGRWRLLHPISFFPLMMVYMMIPPLCFRWAGDPILETSQRWCADPWFLAAPMLVLALAGIFYHIGIRLSKVSLVLQAADDGGWFLGFPVLRNISTVGIVAPSVLVVLSSFSLRLLKPDTEYNMGFYWVDLLFLSFQVIPVIVFHQNRWAGVAFVLGIVPFLLGLGSKAAFLYVPIAFFIFYDQHIFRLSMMLTTVLVVMVAMTPVAVVLYGEGIYQIDFSEFRARKKEMNWDAAIEKISHREYAFEAFACVYQWRRAGDPLCYGSRLLGELIQNIPTVIYQNKQPGYFDFVETYLPDDARGYTTHYARHILTSFLIDFDVPGCCVGMGLIGFVFGSCYRIATNASLRLRQVWPLLLYSALVIVAKSYVEGGIEGGMPRTIAFAVGVGAVLFLSYLFRDTFGSSFGGPTAALSAKPHSNQNNAVIDSA